MFITWLMSCIYLHDILTQRNHSNFLCSQKLESSCELLERTRFIHEHLSREFWPDLPGIVTHVGPRGVGLRTVECRETGSKLEAVAQGRDQLRQYTATNILLDEFAFWDQAEESWGALKPTIEGGGHIDMVSTPELGAFMYRLLYGKGTAGRGLTYEVEAEGTPGAADPTADGFVPVEITGRNGEEFSYASTEDGAGRILPGVSEWDTETGIHVIRVHYTADPAKRTSATWRSQAKIGMSEADWQREYEINWHVAAGLPVFGSEFLRDMHVAPGPLVPQLRSQGFVRSWDFGLTPACVLGQIGADGRFYVLREWVTWDGQTTMRTQGIDTLADEVVSWCNQQFPEETFEDYADPAGWQRSQADLRSCVETLNEFDVWPNPGPMAFEKRRKSLSGLLCKLREGRGMIMVDPRCTMIIEGLGGSYRYKRLGHSDDVLDYKSVPEKNAWSHPMDALMYAVGSLWPVMMLEPEDEDAVTTRPLDSLSRNRASLYY